MPFRLITLAAFVVIASGCTSVKVQPVPQVNEIDHICIQNNPKVIIEDFVRVIEDRLQYHGITTQLMDTLSPQCVYRLTYTARRSWDFATYLSHAELRLYKDNRILAYGEYHLRGKGGLSLTKWSGVKSKMDPVVDQMLGKSY